MVSELVGLVDYFRVSFGVLLYQVKVRVCRSGTEVRVLTTTVLETVRDCVERQTVRDYECQKTVRTVIVRRSGIATL